MVDKPDASFCAEQVRRFDRDRWLTTLFAPLEARRGIFALLAFNLELARTREQVSEPMLGEIRLQWWRETIAGVFAGTPRQHPIAQELAAVVTRYGLDRDPFERLIDARTQDLYEVPPADLAALEAYADATSASLAPPCLALLGVSDAESVSAARSAAIAWALVGLVRAVPFHASLRRVHLPADLLAAEGATVEDLIYGRKPAAIHRVLATIAGRAAAHLRQARQKRVVREALPVLLPAALADLYLRRLRRGGYDPRHPSL
jgi:NADH dehydrogenase [ubiquinone] 1 alpha subcomplex assembly factor 6